MHQHQKKILKLLVEKGPAKYSELKNNFEPDDRFSYHLKQLLNDDFLIKNSEGYVLTSKGVKTSVNFHDSQTLEILEHKIPRLLFIIKKGATFLIKKYFQENSSSIRYGLPSKAIPFGVSSLNKHAKVTIENYYKIHGKVTYRCSQNLIMKNEHNEVLYDFLYLIYDVVVEQENLENFQYEFLTLEEIKKLPNKMSPIDDFILNEVHEPLTERNYFKISVFGGTGGGCENLPITY